MVRDEVIAMEVIDRYARRVCARCRTPLKGENTLLLRWSPPAEENSHRVLIYATTAVQDVQSSTRRCTWFAHPPADA